MMTNDIPYPFKQNNNFYYLCGFEEPNSVLILEKDAEGKEITHLFCKPYDLDKIKWDGPMTGVDRVPEAFGIDYAYPIQKIGEFLKSIQSRITNFYCCLDPYADASYLSPFSQKFEDIKHVIESARLVKTDVEIKLMKKSCEISGEAFIEVMKSIKEGMNEFEIEAKLEYECRKRGSKRLAYPPVVASGISANTLHYTKNDMIIKNGQLVLIDAGGEYFNYSSDITRTIPVSGKFTDAQKDIYNAVLRVVKKCTDLCRPKINVNGNEINMNLMRIHAYSTQFLIQELKELGILKSDRDIYRFYPHMIGHQLGMDVHDPSVYGNEVNLLPGMIITIEPGLYIPEDDDIPEKYRGIGVRIEDDVLITHNNPIVLTKNCPKEIEEIERIMGGYN